MGTETKTLFSLLPPVRSTTFHLRALHQVGAAGRDDMRQVSRAEQFGPIPRSGYADDPDLAKIKTRLRVLACSPLGG